MALFGLDQLVRNSRGEVFAAASVGDRKQSANCSLRPLRHHLQRAHAFSHSLDPKRTSQREQQMGIEAISIAERERYVDFYIETKSKAMASLKDVV